MEKSRRGFLKNLGVASAVAATGSTVLLAKSGHKEENVSRSNGVIVGKSPKKEILYKQTQTWDEFYNSAK